MAGPRSRRRRSRVRRVGRGMPEFRDHATRLLDRRRRGARPRGRSRGLARETRGRLPPRVGDDRRPALPPRRRADGWQRRQPRRRAAGLGPGDAGTVRRRWRDGALRACPRRAGGPAGHSRHRAGRAEGRRQRQGRRADLGFGEDRGARQRRPPFAARLGSRRSAGARLQGVHLVPHPERVPGDRALHRRRGPEDAAGDQHVQRPRHLHHAGRRRVHAQRADAAPAAVHHPAQALLLRLQGRVERRGNLRCGAIPLRRPARRRHRRARLQSGLQSARARSIPTRRVRFRCPRTGCR